MSNEKCFPIRFRIVANWQKEFGDNKSISQIIEFIKQNDVTGISFQHGTDKSLNDADLKDFVDGFVKLDSSKKKAVTYFCLGKNKAVTKTANSYLIKLLDNAPGLLTLDLKGNDVLDLNGIEYTYGDRFQIDFLAMATIKRLNNDGDICKWGRDSLFDLNLVRPIFQFVRANKVKVITQENAK